MNSSSRPSRLSNIWQKPGFLALLLAVELAFHCWGEAKARTGEPTVVSIHANWSDGFKDSLRYRRVSATRFPDGRRTAREYLATIKISVHARTDTSSTLSWTYTNFSLNGEPLADLALELSVSAEGVVRLLNVDELRSKVLQSAVKKGKAGAALEFGGDELANMAANRETLENFYLRDAMLFFYPLGTEVHRDQAVKFDNRLAGIGGDSLRAVDRWTVLPDRDLPAGTFAVEWVEDVDRRDVERYFSALGKGLGVKFAVEKGLLTKKGLYVLDRNTFWPHMMIASTKTGVQDSYEQFDSVELRSNLLDPNWKH